MNAPLNTAVIVYNELKERLIREFEFDGDDPVILDTLDGLQDLKERLVWLAREAQRAEAFAEAIKEIIAENKERKDRFERRSDKLRALIAWAMQETGIKKIEEADMTISQRVNNPSIVTTIDPEDAPEQFRKVKTTYSFDIKTIYEELSDGKKFDWAHFGNASPSITIRTK